jgi:outer membrane usher protein
MPYINGAGDAVLVTTDALGRQVSTTLPFYVTSDVLKQGLSDGAVTLGSLRRNYGIKVSTMARRQAADRIAMVLLTG